MNDIREVIEQFSYGNYTKEEAVNELSDIQKQLLISFVKDWYKDNELVSEQKQKEMVDNFLYQIGI